MLVIIKVDANQLDANVVASFKPWLLVLANFFVVTTLLGSLAITKTTIIA